MVTSKNNTPWTAGARTQNIDSEFTERRPGQCHTDAEENSGRGSESQCDQAVDDDKDRGPAGVYRWQAISLDIVFQS